MLSQIEQILLDCDNTLVLSEEPAFEACAELLNEILAEHKINQHYTGAALLQEFVGQNFHGMLVTLQRQYEFTIPKQEVDRYVCLEMDRVIAKLEQDLLPCDNVVPEIQRIHAAGRYGMAVVSSSAGPRVIASLKKVDLYQYLPADHIFSAATSLAKPTSKPDPAIYLYACKVVDVQPERAVAVEDSKSGALAAIRARIPVIGYVGGYRGPAKKAEMTKTLTDLGVKIVMQDWRDFPDCLLHVENL